MTEDTYMGAYDSDGRPRMHGVIVLGALYHCVPGANGAWRAVDNNGAHMAAGDTLAALYATLGATAYVAASGVAEDAAEDSDGEDDGEWTEAQERAFLAAVEASDKWSLGDNGYSDTVLVCETCGRDNEYSDRAAAAYGVAEDECRHCSPEAFSAYGFTLDTDDCEAYERGDDPVIVLICDACDARYPYADMGAAIDGREDGCGACGRT
jgi:hypothetical protein